MCCCGACCISQQTTTVVALLQTTVCRLHPLLDWVYGSFVSQADSSRQIAKLQLGRQLGTPKQAHTQLVHSLLKQAKIESHAQEYKLLLQDMLEIRQRYQQLKQRYDIPEAPAATDGALESAVAAEAATDSASRPAWPEALPNEVSRHADCGSATDALCFAPASPCQSERCPCHSGL